MDREAIKDCYKAMDKIEKALGGLLYRDAVPAIATLGELRDTISEGLPGGFFAYCDICEAVLGCDDNFASTEDGVLSCEACCHEAQEVAHD